MKKDIEGKKVVTTEEALRKDLAERELLQKAAAGKAKVKTDTEAEGDKVPTYSAAEVSALMPEDSDTLTALAPKAKQSYTIAGAGLFANLTGSTALQSKEDIAKVEEHIKKIAGKKGVENVLCTVSAAGELYNTFTAYEKAFIIALRVLLSDSTPEADKRDIRKRKKEAIKEDITTVEEYEGIDFTGAIKIRPEAYDIYLRKEKSAYYGKYFPTEKEKALLKLGFTPTDIIVILDRNTFIKDYLGGTVGGKQYDLFESALNRLSSGTVAFVDTRLIAKQQLIQRRSSFNALRKGNKVEYNILSLHPIFGRIYTPNYITYPANNAEILNTILRTNKAAEGLLTLYDKILRAAAQNFGTIESRESVQVLSFKEAELIGTLAGEAEVKKNKKRVLERIYSESGINIFYKVGLLTEKVQPPTAAERSAATAAGKDVEVKLLYKRVANSNCKR